MIEIQTEQGGDQWHEERHQCVTGTVLESALGASYSAAKNHWVMGGKTWVFDGKKLIVDGTVKEKAICRKKQTTLMTDLISERQSYLEIDDFTSAAMERGNDLEPLSVSAASERHKVKFEVCGMLQSDSNKYFKFSPDAIARNKEGIIVGGYETKSKAGSKHIEYQLAKAIPSEHLMQCLCPMIMDDSVKWWVFGHYDDRNMIEPLFTTGIKREDYQDFIDAARAILEEFLIKTDEMTIELGGYYNG